MPSVCDRLFAFYGDDVTGSVDVLLQFARRGRSGRLFVGVPGPAALREAATEHDVVGIAGIARSLEGPALDTEVRAALTALEEIHPRVLQYKACSTADSSPTVGNLGTVIEIARELFGDDAIPMLFAQPDFGRYTVFGTHFAAEDGVVHRLDRQPTMSAHPTTPMDEADLVRHLSRQTSLSIGALPFTAFAAPDAVEMALSESSDAAVILDALDDGHLDLLGTALRQMAVQRGMLFAIGSGGLSRALALEHAETPLSAAASGSTPAGGPVLVLSGSRSPQTRRQAAAAAAAGWLVRPFDEGAEHGALSALRSGRSVVLTSDDADLAASVDPLTEIPRQAAMIARRALDAGATRRLVVCGGDTSGRVIRELGVQSLSIIANPNGNVVLLSARIDSGTLDLVLKGGQMGDDDLFEQLRVIGTA